MANQTGKKSRANGEGGIVNVPGSQNLYMIYRIDGKQHKVTTGTTDRAEALKMLKDKLETLNVDGRRGIRPAEDFKNIRYEDIRDSYVDHCKIEGVRFIKRADGTEYLKGIPELDEYFKNVRVISITSTMIRCFTQARMTEVSGSTARRELVTLRAMMNFAKDEGRLAAVPKFSMPEEREGVGRYITPKEFGQVLAALPENLRTFYEFLYATGCREGAARKITWKMVNKDRTAIELPGAITKNGNPLTIHLSGPRCQSIVKLLKSLFRVEDASVFNSTNYRTEWSRAVAKVGLGTFDTKTRKRTGVRIHDCRVSAATNMIRSGVPQLTAMAIGGWETPSVFKRYNIDDETSKVNAMEKAGDYVDVAMKG